LFAFHWRTADAAQQEAVKVSNAEEFCFLGEPILVQQKGKGQRKGHGEKLVKTLQQVKH